MTIQLRYYQQEAIDALYEYFATKDGNPLVVLPTGCHAKGTMILMADGSTKPVEAIVVGDKLMGPDSCPRTVLRLCRGRQPMYRITPKKRAPFVVNRDHILALRCTNEGKGYPSNRNKSHQDFITVGEYMQKSAYWKHLRKLEYSAGVTFDRGEDEHPIPPWVLGALLGDGHLKRGISMTTPDAEVLGEFMECIKAFGMNHRTSYNDSGCPTVHAVGASWRNSPIMDALRELGLLGNLAVEKFVPDQYKFATWHARCEVLAGLLDTDGHKNKGGYDWISKSERLAHDVVFIARSLGIKAQVSAQYKRCQTGAGGIYYRVSLSGDMTRLNMRVERKRADPRKQAKSPHVAGFTLEELGEDDYFGFTLDADHLYLDSEFLIHHNSGKSLTMADFAKGAIQSFPDTNLLLLTHVKELIQQDAQAIIRHWPQAPVGIWSAGLGAKQRNQITVAGIQSIHTHPAKFGRTDLVLVDEAHLISKRSDTMYGRFLAALRESNPALKVIGMTATPYRMDSGLLTQGEHRIFTDIAYEADVGRLIKEGYLCPLVARGTQAAKADLSGVHTRGGEFVEKELQAAMDKEHLIEGALDEVERLAADRNHILGFCAGVEHAAHCAERARARGWSADHVTGDMTAAERDAKINAFKEGRLRFLFNAMILTTGFDAPHIDCILMLRPTKSTGLYVQIMGRGLRLHASKTETLVLDFAGNVERHGPIDQIRVKPKSEKGEGVSVAPVKKCPNCQAFVPTAARECPECGHLFPEPDTQKHGTKASDAVMVAALAKPKVMAVERVLYESWSKAGRRSLAVNYSCVGGATYQEWVPIEDERSYVRKHAVRWFWERGAMCPATVQEALAMVKENRIPSPDAITVKLDGKYWRVIESHMGSSRTDVHEVYEGMLS